MRSPLVLKTAYSAALLLIAVAVLKLFEVWHMPLGSLTDPVLPFLTKREFLLLASIFDAFLAYRLWIARDDGETGWLLVYFASCGTIYHFALYTVGAAGCGCFGAAGRWFGLSSQASSTAAAVLLIIFWCIGSLLIALSVQRNASNRGI